MYVNKQKFLVRLDSLKKRNSKDKEFVNIDLYKLILKEEVLIAAYEKIKSNKKAVTT
jgi:hypothetical protein